MWVATDGDKIVGLRAFMRWEFVRGGEVLHAVRAVDTATHPDYQGKGLFTAMTMHGLDVIKDDGIDFVFNTPNDKSRPGYLKMGWQEVGKLPVAIRVAGPRAAREGGEIDGWHRRTGRSDRGIGQPVRDVVVGAWPQLRVATRPFHDHDERRRPASTSGGTAPTSSATGQFQRRRIPHLSCSSAWRRQGVGDARLARARHLRRPTASQGACCEPTGWTTRCGSARSTLATDSCRPQVDQSSPGARCVPKRCRHLRTGMSVWATWSSSE